MIFWSADWHLFHSNVIRFNNRPFSNVQEMNETLVSNHNSKVGLKDTCIHVGDFSFGKTHETMEIVRRMNGENIFLMGSHDQWLGDRNKHPHIWEGMCRRQYVVACHYAMRVWPRSHYGSWMVYGHSHGNLPPEGKSWDVGVDNNGYFPVSFDELSLLMKDRPDNFNLIKR